MVQPAPRMMKAPATKSAEVPRTLAAEAGGRASGAASSVLNRHGRNRYSVPAGLSRRDSSAYGISGAGSREMKPLVGGR